MKAISLWEPWASLMAYKLKQIETRHWETRYRGLLAIHAAKRPMTKDDRYLLDYWIAQQWITGFMATPGWKPAYGCIVAVTTLHNIVPTERCSTLPPKDPRLIHVPVSAAEEAFGNYEPCRYAWITEATTRCIFPVPFVGRQGLFEVPDELVFPSIRKFLVP